MTDVQAIAITLLLFLIWFSLLGILFALKSIAFLIQEGLETDSRMGRGGVILDSGELPFTEEIRDKR